jgi:hypothetical protein
VILKIPSTTESQERSLWLRADFWLGGAQLQLNVIFVTKASPIAIVPFLVVFVDACD